MVLPELSFVIDPNQVLSLDETCLELTASPPPASS